MQSAPAGGASRFNLLLACAFALAAGLAIAWVDSRPTWDDTGISAAALFVASGLAAALSARWWLATLLVAGPLVVVESSGMGVGLLIPPAIALIGGLLGALVRRSSTPRSEM